MNREERSVSPRLPSKRASMAIENRQKSVRVKMRTLQIFLAKVMRELGLDNESVAVRLLNDTEMARLNGQYRNKRRTTDVLSFPAEERRRPSSLRSGVRKLRGSFLGDIAISPVVAGRNARAFGRRLEDELQILTLHGVLHLLGYDHETDRGEMNRVETRLRRRLGIVQ
jgi:probable rRNA maturation factor